MRYLQSGGFQNNPSMRLTLGFTLALLAGFAVTNFFLYFAKMDLSPGSVVSYYSGSEEEFRQPRSYQSMLEVTHGHLAIMALVFLLLTHLMIFAPLSPRGKTILIAAAFLSALVSEGAGWLVRFVHPVFASLKVISFLVLQGSFLFLLFSLGSFLWDGRKRQQASEKVLLESETEEDLTEEEAHLP